MKRLSNRIQSIYREYPRAFWIYNIIIFIDRLGGFMLYPFFALYLTQKYHIGMSTVGLIFAIFSVSGFVGSALGGALTDRMGRRGVIIFSLILSSLSALGMGFAPTLAIFIAVSVIVGTLANIGGPAHEAVVADLLPPKKRAEGYGIIRVIFNMAVIIAPAIAGLLIARSYILLFIVDAVISLISAGIVLFVLPETKPEAHAHAKPETMKQTFAGYGRVFKDIPFVAFIGVTIMMTLVYMNMNSTLGVFLRDQHGLPEIGYGSLISINAIIVVILQFWFSRRLQKYKPMLMMAAGSLLYAVGFAMYGVVSTYVYFVLAMVVITIGEMIVSPFQQALVASLHRKRCAGAIWRSRVFPGASPSPSVPILQGSFSIAPTPIYSGPCVDCLASWQASASRCSTGPITRRKCYPNRWEQINLTGILQNICRASDLLATGTGLTQGLSQLFKCLFPS